MESLLHLVQEIRKCERAGALTAALTMCFVCFDTMAFLGMPLEETRNTRRHFIAWVDRYLSGHSDQPYAYRGKDVYAARCALLHRFGAEAAPSQSDEDIRTFVYSDGGRHAYNPEINASLVIIGAASFINDSLFAVRRFLEEAQHNVDLRNRIGSRLEQVLRLIPLSN